MKIKKIILLSIALSTGILMHAQTVDDELGDSNSFCAQMGINKIVVMHNGEAITEDTKLNNGIIIQTDGTIILKDRSKTLLREGQCIDKEGKIQQ